MAISTHLIITLLFALVSFPLQVLSQACNTDHNPYCKGNAAFEAICCPYPNVCYWSDRTGAPACCAFGQSCQNGANGGPLAPPEATVYATVTQQVTKTLSATAQTATATAPLSTITTTLQHSGGIFPGVTSTIAGAYSTAVQVLIGQAADLHAPYLAPALAAAGVAAWHIG